MPRQKSRLAVVVGAIGVLVATVAVWAGHPWGSHPPVSSGAPNASSAGVARADLLHLVRGKTAVVVPLRTGFEAAAYDQYGHIDFWAGTSASWTLQAARMYQSDAADSETAAAYTGTGVSVSGALLPGMSDATFVVQSAGFSGDGSASYDVYTRGASGWGYVAQSGTRLMPTGRSATSPQDAFFGAWLHSAGLQTADEPGVFSAAVGSYVPLVDWWRWDNGRFDLARDNTLTASLQPSPDFTARPLPWGVPRTGTYGGVLDGVVFGPPFPGGTQAAVVLYVTPTILDPVCLRANTCPVPQKSGALPSLRFTLNGQTVFDYAVTTSTGPAYISGPAWFLAMMDPYPQGNDQDASDSPYSARALDPGGLQGGIPGDYAQEGGAPWYISPRLDLQAFSTIEGYVQLTFKNGALVHATVY